MGLYSRPIPEPDPERPGIAFTSRDVVPASVREILDDEVGRSARSLVASLGNGWTARTTYGHGPRETHPVVDGRQRLVWMMTYSVTVRLRHVDGGAAVATWLDGKAAGAWTWVLCADPDCSLYSVGEHAIDIPTVISMADLRVLVSDVPALRGTA